LYKFENFKSTCFSIKNSKTPLPDNLATLNVGMKHLAWMYGMNEAALKAQTNECRGGGV
jgi:hypothetical protein